MQKYALDWFVPRSGVPNTSFDVDDQFGQVDLGEVLDAVSIGDETLLRALADEDHIDVDVALWFESVDQGSVVKLGAVGYASQATYLPSGSVAQIIRPGTAWSALTFGYDQGTRQLTSIDDTMRLNNLFTLQALREYTRNPAGTITRASTTSAVHGADVQCFRYTPNQALTDAWTSASGDCATGPTAPLGGPAAYRVNYKIDMVTGNRTEATKWVGVTATVSTYTYPAAGAARPHAVQKVSAVTGTGAPVVTNYAYDAVGATTTRGAQTLTYDTGGRLATVAQGGTTENSLYSPDGALLMKWGGTDGASLFLGDTVVRSKSGITTGIRSYSIAGIQIAERVTGTGGGCGGRLLTRSARSLCRRMWRRVW